MEPPEPQPRTRPALALVAGIAAIWPGIFIGIAAGVVAQGGIFFLSVREIGLGLADLAGALVAGALLPALALWLGGTSRNYSSLGRAGWYLGWSAIAVVLAANASMYVFSALVTSHH